MNLMPEQFAVLSDAAAGNLNHWFADRNNDRGTNRWYVEGVDEPLSARAGSPMSSKLAAVADQCVAKGWLHEFNDYNSGGSNAKTVQYRISVTGKVELQVYERQLKRAKGELVE